jgi:hypothetical protein
MLGFVRMLGKENKGKGFILRQRIVVPSVSRGIGTTINFTFTMAGTSTDPMIRLPVFHGTGRADAEQHWFICEAIWAVNRVTDNAVKIAQLETTLRDHALQRYMKSKIDVPAGQTSTLDEIIKRFY